MAAAMQALHYSRRTWPSAIGAASVPVSGEVLRWLEDCDAKREDALLAARRVASHLVKFPGWGHRPRRDPGSVFGLSGPGRERPLDVMMGRDVANAAPGFTVWMLATGRAAPWLEADTSALALLRQIDVAVGCRTRTLLFSPAPFPGAQEAVAPVYATMSARMQARDEFESEWLRYDAACLAKQRHQPVQGPNDLDKAVAGMQIALRHGCDTWEDAIAGAGRAYPALVAVRELAACCQAFRRAEMKSGRHHD
jgi:hypothetical protein